MKTIAVLFFSSFLMLIPNATGAAEEPRPETVTIAGATYTVVPDEKMREMGFEFADVPPEENAATYYLQAIEVYWEPERGSELYKLRDAVLFGRWTEESAPLTEYLEKNRETLALIEKAAAKSVCHFPFLLREGESLGEDASVLSIQFPHLGRMREFARFLIVVGKKHEFEQHHAEALGARFLILRLGDHVAQDPTSINGLVGLACDGIGMGAIDRCLARSDLDGETLARAQKRVHELSKRRPNFVPAMRTERAFSLETAEWHIRHPEWILHLREETAEGEVDAAARQWACVIESKEGRKWVCWKIREFWEFFDALLALPLHEYLKKKEEFKVRMLGVESPPKVVRTSLPALWVLPKVSIVRMFAPPLWNTRITYGKDELYWTVLDVEFALARYKAKHGKYPGKLNEIKPLMLSDGLDPFSGEPLHYRREADGSFTIWSVGENLTDDGGEVVGEKHNPWRGDDYVWSSRLLAGAPAE